MGTSVFLNPNVIPISNPFNQDLNTTDSPTFDNLTLTGDGDISGDLAVGGNLALTGELNFSGDGIITTKSFEITSDEPGDDVTGTIHNESDDPGSVARWRLQVGSDQFQAEWDGTDLALTGAGQYTFDAPVVASTVDVGAAGVRLSGANGVLTMLGRGDGQDESLTWDFNATANAVNVGTGSGVTKIDFGTITLEGKFSASTGAAGTSGTLTGLTTATVVDGIITVIV